MKMKRAFCEDCNDYRPFVHEPPCSGIESLIWFALAFFSHWAFGIILVWRNISFTKKWNCKSCGSTNHRDVK